ncbi:ATP-binding protein [Streptomyces longwoodensis]|uniref:ATP-binding protein n=1 Tax=Streptomyces longwoodensis TaxID=68231 RepID=UPI00340B1881
MPATAPSPTAPRHAVDLPRGLHTPAVARHITQRWLETADQTHRLDDAVLIVSELVTNAVRHTGASCRLALSLQNGRLDIAVADHSEDLPEIDRHAGRTAHGGGYGMNIIEQLGGDMTVVPGLGGKTVHVVLPLRPGPDARRSE